MIPSFIIIKIKKHIGSTLIRARYFRAVFNVILLLKMRNVSKYLIAKDSRTIENTPTPQPQ